MDKYTKEFFVEAGRKGGKKTARKYTKRQRREWGAIRKPKKASPVQAQKLSTEGLTG